MNISIRMIRFISILTIIFGISAEQSTYAKENDTPSRQKIIDFEGDLVEGVNKRPLDSLSEISEAQKRKRKMHLYRKRKGFRSETLETIREMRNL
jgi:hypothetical protein